MSAALQNICLIDVAPTIIKEFEKLGCTVLSLRDLPGPYLDLPAELDKHDFVPDLVLQIENLGGRSLVTGLENIDCPLIYWCVDPHLNAHWHSTYGRLFDVVCTTQRAWIPALKQHGAQDVRWLPWFGRDVQWTDWKDRRHGLAFVGRVTEQRPARKWMVEFLQEKAGQFNPAIEQDLTFGQMLDLYRASRIIPNESILGETNFRLFEGASCGCMVLSQDLGEEQEELFERGREFDTYSYITDFDEKLSLYLTNDRLTQAMGRAAYERVQAEHLPGHRIQRILEFAHAANRNRALGDEATKWEALTACVMWEIGMVNFKPSELLTRLSRLPQDSDLAVAALRIQTITNRTELLTDNVKTLLAADLFADSMELNLAGSMAALRVEHWDGAKAFWYRHLKSSGSEALPPQDSKELLTLWAKQLKQSGRSIRAGYPFDPARHLPDAASECLMTILADDTNDLPTLRLLDTILAPVTGLEQTRVGFLSILTLFERTDWRLALEIALANLKSYRLKSGMEELQLALELARQQGQEASFERVLKARDPSGGLTKRLNQ